LCKCGTASNFGGFLEKKIFLHIIETLNISYDYIPVNQKKPTVGPVNCTEVIKLFIYDGFMKICLH
jgi:hypothetical protein